MKLIGFLGLGLLSSCAMEMGGPPGDGGRGDAMRMTGGDVPIGRSVPDAAVNPNAACTAVVTMGLYGDDTCTPGSEVMLIRFDLAQDCYGWQRDSNRGVVDNSASRFQCYRDRLCYTQTPSSLSCGGRPENKQSRTDGCTLEPQGNLWTRIIGGTDRCPVAPAGFECPTSGSAGGTPGVVPATACAAASTTGGTGTATVAGVAINHSMNRLAAGRTGRTPEYSNLRVEAVSVDALAASGASAPALAGSALETSMCGSMGGCAWSIGGVNLGGFTQGLAARLRDNRASGQLWVTTMTDSASPAQVTASATTGRFEDGRAFAVSRDAIDTVIAPMVGLTGDQVMERGFVFGLVYNPYSGRAADGSGTPVVGATVRASSSALRIVYPNNMFSGTASATANQGAFLAVPNSTGAASTTTFTVTPPSGGTQTWDSTRVAVVAPGAVYFIPMYAR